MSLSLAIANELKLVRPESRCDAVTILLTTRPESVDTIEVFEESSFPPPRIRHPGIKVIIARQIKAQNANTFEKLNITLFTKPPKSNE